MQTAERLTALIEHLGLEAAHFATQLPGDIAGLASGQPDRIKGLVLCVPMRLDARPFERVASRLLMISGELGLSAQMTLNAQEHLRTAQRHILRGYNAEGWSDVVADRTAEVAGAIVRFLASATEQPTNRVPLAARSGTHAGLTYRIEGQGPALILLPFFLAPSQWQPALPELTRHFTVIQLGGPHIGGVAALEDRARAPTYQAMFRTLVDLMAPEAERRSSTSAAAPAPSTACWPPGLARPRASMQSTSIPSCCARPPTSPRTWPGDSLRPGKRAVVAVCRSDLRLHLLRHRARGVQRRSSNRRDDALGAAGRPHRTRGTRHRSSRNGGICSCRPSQGQGRNTAAVRRPGRRGGCQPVRAHAPRGTSRTCALFPALITLDVPQGPIWRYREDHVLSQLAPAEMAAWNTARQAATEDGLLMQAHALHCAVATKPK